MNKGTKTKKKKKSGFRTRMQSASGQRIIKTRRRKKRNKLSI